jgi:hypothetical protein
MSRQLFKSSLVGALAFVAGVAITAPASATVIFQDDFEASALNARPSKTMGGARWADNNSTSVSSTLAKTGSRSLRFDFQGNTNLNEDAFSEQRFELGGQYREVWISYDLYIPDNYFHRVANGSSNNKGLVFLWSGEYSGETSTGLHFWPIGSGSSQISVDRNSNNSAVGHILTGNVDLDRRPAAQGGDLGRWVNFVIRARTADVSASNGVVQVWKDGKQIVNHTNLNNWSRTKNYFERGYLLGWANSGFNQNTTLYIDNVKMGTTEADVKSTTTPTPSAAPPAAPVLRVTQ